MVISVGTGVRSAQRSDLREINLDTLVSILTRRGLHQRDRLVTLKREKQYCFSKKTHMGTAGLEPGAHA